MLLFRLEIFFCICSPWCLVRIFCYIVIFWFQLGIMFMAYRTCFLVGLEGVWTVIRRQFENIAQGLDEPRPVISVNNSKNFPANPSLFWSFNSKRSKSQNLCHVYEHYIYCSHGGQSISPILERRRETQATHKIAARMEIKG